MLLDKIETVIRTTVYPVITFLALTAVITITFSLVLMLTYYFIGVL